MPKRIRIQRKHPLSDTSEDEVAGPAPAVVEEPVVTPAGHDEDDQEALAASASDVDAADEVDFRSPASPPRLEDLEAEEVDMSNPSPDATPAALAATTPAALV
jgi:hypothetical protein